MSDASSSVINLGNLGLDVFSLVLALIDGRDVAKLWLCGSSNLTRSIENGTTELRVHKTDIEKPLQFKQIRWPGFLFRRLHRLRTLEFGLGESSACIKNGDYNDLPASLTSLHIGCVNAWTLLFNSTPPNSSFEGLVDRRPPLNTPLFHIAERLPRLATLELKGCDVDATSRSVNDRIVRLLPPTLTRFIHPSYVQFSSCGIASLPPFLQNLSITWKEGVNHVTFESLPKSLTQISIDHPLFDDDSVANLPPSVTEANLSSTALTRKSLALLPRPLKSLTIIFGDGLIDLVYHHSCVSQMPNNLISLTIMKSNGFSMGDEMCKLLPRTLKRLTTEAAFVSDLGISFLPRSLTYLSLEMCRAISDACVPLLPRGLITLSLGTTRSITGASASDLPPGLTTLNLPFCSFFYDQHIKDLPRTITNLSLRAAGNLTVECLGDLPPHLSNFNAPNPALSTRFLRRREEPQPSSSCCIQ